MSPLLTVLLSALVGAIVSLCVDAIKARSAGRWWEAQERWKLKRDLYVRLLEALWELADAFREQITLETVGADADYTPRRTQERRERYARALKDVCKGRGPLPLLLSAQTVAALDELDRADAIDCPAPYLEAVQNVYAAVLKSAREDLRLHVR